jgi:peptidoglycan/LPS O-acetylase OafA/YrhL
MNSSPLTENENLPALDGFRGLAILLVICYHFEIINSWGWMGVDLFFVLSGFLISKSLSKGTLNKEHLIRFFRNRILRIVPATYLSLLLFFLLVPLLKFGAESESFQILKYNQFYYWAFQTDIWYALDGFPAMVFLLPLWSLGVEAKFYLLWPLFFWVIKSLTSWGKWIFLVLIILISIVFRSYAHYWFPSFENIYRYVFFLCRLDAFAIGTGIYFLSRQGWYGIDRRWWGVLAAIIFIYFLVLFLSGNWNGHYSSNWVSFIGFTLIACGWAAMIAFILQSSNVCSWLFQSKWLVWLGKYSYGIYVFHYPIWLLIHKTALPAYLFLPVAILVTMLSGYLSFSLVERPFLNWKK